MPEQIKIPHETCQRCGHTWNLRKPELPRVCPKCKSPYWDKPRQAAKRAGKKK